MPSTPGSTTPRSKSTRAKAAAPLRTPGPPAAGSVTDRVAAPADSAPAAIGEPTREAMIRMVAYSFYERRGYVAGSELQDWLQAEMEVDRQLAPAPAPSPAPRKRPAPQGDAVAGKTGKAKKPGKT